MPRPTLGDAPLSRAEITRRSRLKKAGAVALTQDAALALERLRLPGETKTDAVARVLARAAKSAR